ncbi:MAG: large subunit ribosomal protein L18 [Parcubacteria group bacterium Gr01-1014_73]|nr:MAG: large subunit ribosomal protein L18 [Parcubacteria group bacterium Gr01-1014_73]
MSKLQTEKRIRRHKRIRAKITGTAERPRLSVFKSNKYLYAEIIDDVAGRTLATASSLEFNKKMKEEAREVGKTIAQRAGEKKIKNIVFDRGGYVYTGKVKALADAAREGGLVF